MRTWRSARPRRCSRISCPSFGPSRRGRRRRAGAAPEATEWLMDLWADAYVAKRAAEAMLQDLLPILRAFEEGTASPGWAKEIRGLGEIPQREIVTELLARTTHLNAILQNLGEGILFLDPSYRILYVNPTGTALLQHPESELVGTPLATFLEAGDEDPFLDTLRALRTHQGPASEQLVYAYRDRTFHLTLPNLQEEQWAAGQLVIIRDVTRLFRRMHELAVLNDLAVLLASTSDVDD